MIFFSDIKVSALLNLSVTDKIVLQPSSNVDNLNM